MGSFVKGDASLPFTQPVRAKDLKTHLETHMSGEENLQEINHRMSMIPHLYIAFHSFPKHVNM